MILRYTAGRLVSNRLYGAGVGSHIIRNFLKGVGIPMSTKSIVKNALISGVPKKSTWNRRLRRKTNTSDHLPLRIAQAFCAWWSYYVATGNFDVGAIAKGEKPP